MNLIVYLSASEWAFMDNKLWKIDCNLATASIVLMSLLACVIEVRHLRWQMSLSGDFFSPFLDECRAWIYVALLMKFNILTICKLVHSWAQRLLDVCGHVKGFYYFNCNRNYSFNFFKFSKYHARSMSWVLSCKKYNFCI